MADFSLRDLWWLKPEKPDNPLPAMQLGASIVQHKAQLDLKEKELANDVARTSLMRDAQMYKMSLQTRIEAGNTAIAGAMAGVTDWADPEQVKRVYDVGAKYPLVVGGKAWAGAEYMTRNAIAAKRMSENTQSLIQSRQDRTELNRLVEERRALLADSTVDVNDARIQKLNQDIGMAERELAVKERNVNLRDRDITVKEKRSTQNWTPEDRIEYNRRSKVVEDNGKLSADEKDEAIKRLHEEIEIRRKDREAAKAKKVAPASPTKGTNRISVISPDGKPGDIPESQLDEALKAGYKRP